MEMYTIFTYEDMCVRFTAFSKYIVPLFSFVMKTHQ